MANAFKVAVDTIYRDPNMRVAVFYHPPVGPAVPVTSLRWQDSEDVINGQQVGRSRTNIFEIRRSEAFVPERGGRIEIVGPPQELYRIKSTPQIGDDGISWILDVGNNEAA